MWIQVTYNLSVITACVPSMKGIFESMLGNTMGLSIEEPYQLENISRRSLSQPNPRARLTKVGTKNSGLGIKGHMLSIVTKKKMRYSGYMPRHTDRSNDGQSESVQDLTDGVVLVSAKAEGNTT